MEHDLNCLRNQLEREQRRFCISADLFRKLSAAVKSLVFEKIAREVNLEFKRVLFIPSNFCVVHREVMRMSWKMLSWNYGKQTKESESCKELKNNWKKRIQTKK